MSWYVVGGGFNHWLCEGGPVTGQGCFCKFDDNEHWDKSVISSLALMHYTDYHYLDGTTMLLWGGVYWWTAGYNGCFHFYHSGFATYDTFSSRTDGLSFL